MKLVEKVVAQRPPRLDSLIVEREALHEQFAEPSRRPLTKSRADRRANAVADREDSVQIVMVDESGDLAAPLDLNYLEFPDSSRGIEFAFFVNIDQMLPAADVRHHLSA